MLQINSPKESWAEQCSLISYGANVSIGGRVTEGMNKSSSFLKSQLVEGHTIYGESSLG